MIYNKIDQVVLSQDAVLRLTNQWIATKYDNQGRVIITGLWPAGTQTQSDLQIIYNNAPDWAIWDSRDYTDNITGYKIVSYALPAQYLTINYYDDYTNIPGLPASFIVGGNSIMTRGLLTATKTLVLNTIYNSTLDMLCTAHYYDDLGRNVKNFEQHYLGGTASPYNYDVISNTYNFNNEVIGTARQHFNTTNTAAPVLTVNNTYTYDHAGRKTQTKEKINGGTNVLLSQLTYNEVGQLMQKQLHGNSNGSSFLQAVNYSYNERGWLSKSSAPLFEEQLQYNNTGIVSGISPVAQYNGNIASQSWGTSTSPDAKSYVYLYDRLNRLVSGSSPTAGFNYQEKSIAYDLNGNIQSLQRYWAGNAIDQLAYLYTNAAGNYTNQLQSITDSSPDTGPNGYKSGTYAYAYDNNGNMVTDNSKGITGTTGITYNLLNLPQSINSKGITYYYDATGKKLRRVTGTAATDYIEGIQYDGGVINFIQTEEGRVINSGGSYTNYEYTLTDHLGNSRVSFDSNGGGATAKQTDDYLPFGMDIQSLANNPPNKYLYNKKELQDGLGVYDYGARFYDPVIGRMTSMDPAGEKFFMLSPYSYAANNPVLINDPTGKDWSITLNVDKDGVTHYHILFTGAIVDETKDHKGHANDLAKSITKQFQSLFNQDKSKGDGEGGTGFTVDARAQIRAVDSEDDVATTETLFKIEDRNNKDFEIDAKYEARAITLNGKEIAINEHYVPGILNGSLTKTITHEIGHLGGLKHPDADKGFFGIFGGYSVGLENTRNFMNAGGDKGDALNKTPDGPTRDQLYHIYELYKSGKLNRKDINPVEQ